MFFDSHVHTEGLGISDLKRMREGGITEVCSLYYYPIRPLFPQTLIDGFRRLKEFENLRCSKIGIKMFPAVGIHPRCIPPDYKTVIENLEASEWKIFGEIGLETGSDVEVDVFRKQLEVAILKDVPCVIHTPRKNKKEITEKTLEILRKLNFPEELAVVDHVNFENLELVVKSGFWIGLTVQVDKLSSESALEIIEKVGDDRVIINSDAGFDNDLVTTVADTAKILGERAEKVCFENAKRFLGV